MASSSNDGQSKTTMTDAELADFLGVADYPPDKVSRYIASLPPEKRVTYERMHQVTIGLQLWEQGLGQKPEGVIVCREHKHDRRRMS